MVQTQIFDLYYILVETVFGSIAMSFIALVIIFAIIAFLTRMSGYTLIVFLMIFTLVFGIGYAGAAVAIPVFVIALAYFSHSLVQFTRRFM